MKIQKNTKKSLKPVIISVITVLLIAGSVGAYFLVLKNNQEPADTPDDSSINYEPPTKQEVDSSQDGKKNNDGQSTETPSTSDPATNKRKVSVGIAFANYDPDEKAVDIRAFTPDAIEGDGKCTATLTQGSKTVTQSSEAFIDSSSSQCEPILIPASKFGSGGTWKLTVSYVSSKSAGTSPTMEVSLDV
jgi:hypothetical protein